MHSITHLIESIRRKGVTVNTSTDNGEALHPQTRRHWQRSNHQAQTAEDQVGCFYPLVAQFLRIFQMLRMQYEKEVVLNIRHRIEMYEQEQQFDDNVADEDYVETLSERSHIQFGSRQRGLSLKSYEEDLEEKLGFRKFGDSLASFFRDRGIVEVYGSDFEGDGFVGHQNYIYWYKVSSVSLSLAAC